MQPEDIQLDASTGHKANDGESAERANEYESALVIDALQLPFLIRGMMLSTLSSEVNEWNRQAIV
jgi:hypothetical protein